MWRAYSGLLTFALLPTLGLEVPRPAQPSIPVPLDNITTHASTNAIVFIGQSFERLSGGHTSGGFAANRYATTGRPHGLDGGGPRISLVYQLQQRPGTYAPRIESDFELMLARNVALPATTVMVSRTMALTDMFNQVLSYVPPVDTAAVLAVVCKQWHRACAAAIVWQGYFLVVLISLAR